MILVVTIANCANAHIFIRPEAIYTHHVLMFILGYEYDHIRDSSARAMP